MQKVMAKVLLGDEKISCARRIRETEYAGTPRNIYRHILVSGMVEYLQVLLVLIHGRVNSIEYLLSAGAHSGWDKNA